VFTFAHAVTSTASVRAGGVRTEFGKVAVNGAALGVAPASLFKKAHARLATVGSGLGPARINIAGTGGYAAAATAGARRPIAPANVAFGSAFNGFVVAVNRARVGVASAVLLGFRAVLAAEGRVASDDSVAVLMASAATAIAFNFVEVRPFCGDAVDGARLFVATRDVVELGAQLAAELRVFHNRTSACLDAGTTTAVTCTVSAPGGNFAVLGSTVHADAGVHPLGFLTHVVARRVGGGVSGDGEHVGFSAGGLVKQLDGSALSGLAALDTLGEGDVGVPVLGALVVHVEVNTVASILAILVVVVVVEANAEREIGPSTKASRCEGLEVVLDFGLGVGEDTSSVANVIDHKARLVPVLVDPVRAPANRAGFGEDVAEVTAFDFGIFGELGINPSNFGALVVGALGGVSVEELGSEAELLLLDKVHTERVDELALGALENHRFAVNFTVDVYGSNNLGVLAIRLDCLEGFVFSRAIVKTDEAAEFSKAAAKVVYDR